VGQLDKARGFADQASTAAVNAGEKETAASYELDAAQWEVLYGNPARAKERVDKALALAGDRDTQYGAAVTLAFAGELPRATAIADALNRRFPEDTFVQSCYLPVIRGVVALKRKDSAGAVRELAAASPYELGLAGGLLPVYIRGLAYLDSGDGNRASTEFQKIIDHPGVVLNSPVGSMAWLELGRAEALSGQRTPARRAYQDFLQKWQNADTDVPILIEAKAENKNLR
jgi:eukaryotic-like serine/threonine-protein kinase